MGEGSAHVGAAKCYQSQGFVYDIRKHRSQGQKGQVCLADKTGGGKGKAQMGKEKHHAAIGPLGI
jgi:hypothetical protein